MRNYRSLNRIIGQRRQIAITSSREAIDASLQSYLDVINAQTLPARAIRHTFSFSRSSLIAINVAPTDAHSGR